MGILNFLCSLFRREPSRWGVINSKIDIIMSKQQEIQDQLDRIQNGLSNVAADVRGLKEDIAEGLTAEQAEALKVRTSDLADKIEALAAETADKEEQGGGDTETGDGGGSEDEQP